LFPSIFLLQNNRLTIPLKDGLIGASAHHGATGISPEAAALPASP